MLAGSAITKCMVFSCSVHRATVFAEARRLTDDRTEKGDTLIPGISIDGRKFPKPIPPMFPRLLILFIGIPLIELILFLQIGSRIGLPATIATVVLTGIIGASLTKSQGLQVLSKYQKALAEGRMPHAEVIEGLMVLVAGAVLLTPGFLTDAIGFALLIPPVRAAVRAFAAEKLKNNVEVRVANAGATFTAAAGSSRGGNPTSPSQTGTTTLGGKPVIDVEAEIEVDEADSHRG